MWWISVSWCGQSAIGECVSSASGRNDDSIIQIHGSSAKPRISTTGSSVPSSRLQPRHVCAAPPHIGDHHAEQQQRQQHRKRGALAVIAARPGGEERVQRQRLRRGARAAAGHHQDQVERVRHPDHAQQQRGGDDAGEPGQRDVAELPRRARAVDRGGFVEFAGDRLQAGQQRHGEERKPLPHHGKDHAGHRGARLRQPRHRVRQDAQPHADVVQHAEIEVEHPGPDQPDDHATAAPTAPPPVPARCRARRSCGSAAAPW